MYYALFLPNSALLSLCSPVLRQSNVGCFVASPQPSQQYCFCLQLLLHQQLHRPASSFFFPRYKGGDCPFWLPVRFLCSPRTPSPAPSSSSAQLLPQFPLPL